jgi:hypothetical protein
MLAVLERGGCRRALRRLSVLRHGAPRRGAEIGRLQSPRRDYDKTWPSGVTRTRDMLTLAEERSA